MESVADHSASWGAVGTIAGPAWRNVGSFLGPSRASQISAAHRQAEKSHLVALLGGSWGALGGLRGRSGARMALVGLS